MTMTLLVQLNPVSAQPSKETEEATTLPEVVVQEEATAAYTRESRTDVTANAAALPAPTTILDAEYVRQSPYTGTYGNLLRQLPAVNVDNFGQGGVGYGIAIRGFTDVEHGRDVAYFIDGVPVNEVSSIHTPNYADLNILIPETIERVELIRGPFTPLYGDSNLGGSLNIVTKRFDRFGLVSGYGGYFNTARGVVTYSRPRSDDGSVVPFLAFEGYTTDGYRDNQGYKRYNLFGKVTVPTRHGDLSLRAQFYGGEWGAPGYINRNLVESGLLSPRAAVNPTDGGHKDFQNVVVNYGLGELDQAFTVTGFVNHDVFVRFADFGSGQRVQDEDRTTMGLTLRKVWTTTLFDVMPAQLMIGTNYRVDSVGTIQQPTVARNPTGPPTQNYSFTENGWGQYVQAQLKPVSWLKITGGTRYDHFWYDVDDRLGLVKTPQYDTGTVSPKAGIALTPLPWVEFFANYGEGFRSPSVAFELQSVPNPKPQKLRSQEAGVQLTPGRFRFLADVYTTTLDHEVFQPATGLTLQDIGRSRREGYEIEGRYTALQGPDRQAAIFVNFTQIRAVLRDRAPSVVVPNVPAYILNIGTDFNVPLGGSNSPHRITGLLYGQYYGKKNLTEDGAMTTHPYPRVSGRLTYVHVSGWSGYVDLIWYPADRLSETAINFGNGTGASTSDIFVNPQAPVTLMAGVSYRFKTGG